MIEVFLVFISFVIFIYFKNRKIYAAGDKFPGPRALPLLGNSLDFGSNSREIFLKVNEFCRKYERFFRIWNNGTLFVLCYEPQDVEVILSSSKHLRKMNLYRFLYPWIGEGLISTSVISTWRAHRKILTPTFHFKILYQFLEVFNRNSDILSQQLKERVGKGPFNICKYIKLAALDDICEFKRILGGVVCDSSYLKSCFHHKAHCSYLKTVVYRETAMGVNVNAQINSDSDYVKAINDINYVVSMRFYKVWLMIEPIFNLTKYAKIQRNCLKILHGTTNKIVKERREIISKQEGKEEGDEEETFYTKRKLAFLDLLLESEDGSRLSDKDIREEVATFMFAGHDTISSAMSFTIYNLAQNSDVQEKAYREQLDIFGDSKRLPTYEDIQDMKYLDQVLKETQRLYPSVPVIGREIQDELTFSGGYHVPKGTQLGLNIYALHRNPKIWKDPETFNPDNFLPDSSLSRHPYAYVPFSAGPRNCIGQKYAMLAMKSTVSMVLRNYKILPSPHPEHKLNLIAEVVLSSTSGCHVQIEPRH